MSKLFGGLVKVSRSSSLAGSKTDIKGKIASSSTLDVENIKTEAATTQVWGGGQLTGELHILSHEDYSMLEADMINDNEHHYHFHYNDGRVLSTTQPINIFVRIGTLINAREGVAPMILDFDAVGPQSMLTDTTN